MKLPCKVSKPGSLSHPQKGPDSFSRLLNPWLVGPSTGREQGRLSVGYKENKGWGETRYVEIAQVVVRKRQELFNIPISHFYYRQQIRWKECRASSRVGLPDAKEASTPRRQWVHQKQDGGTRNVEVHMGVLGSDGWRRSKEDSNCSPPTFCQK